MHSIARRCRNRGSFTIVELAIVATVMVVVSLATYGMLSNGVRIWQHMQKRIPAEDVVILFDRMSSDIRNSFTFKGIGVIGTKEGVEFPTLVDSKDLGFRSAGRVAYYIDSSGNIIREERDYSLVHNEKMGLRRACLGRVDKASFEYYTFDRQAQEYVWTEDWAGQAMPLAVRVSIGIQEEGQRAAYIRTFSVPVSA